MIKALDFIHSEPGYQPPYGSLVASEGHLTNVPAVHQKSPLLQVCTCPSFHNEGVHDLKCINCCVFTVDDRTLVADDKEADAFGPVAKDLKIKNLRTYPLLICCRFPF